MGFFFTHNVCVLRFTVLASSPASLVLTVARSTSRCCSPRGHPRKPTSAWWPWTWPPWACCRGGGTSASTTISCTSSVYSRTWWHVMWVVLYCSIVVRYLNWLLLCFLNYLLSFLYLIRVFNVYIKLVQYYTFSNNIIAASSTILLMDILVLLKLHLMWFIGVYSFKRSVELNYCK